MSSYVRRETPANTDWFVHDRFGIFLVWGLYSLPARHEWVKSRERITDERYDVYFRHFDPDLYDAREWARKAKAAGMKYAVLTAKHHDGFCLFDSVYTDYKSTNTPCRRDLVREYVDAFRSEGLRVGLYYSLLDWHHPEFPIDCFHPRRNDPDAYEQSRNRDMKKYAEYMRSQVSELLTNYGKIDILWLDFSYSARAGFPEWMAGKGKDDWEAEKLIATARALQPEILINNRSGVEQDFYTPEQFQPTEPVRHAETGELVTWEACHTFSGSWGYHRDESTWKSPRMLIELLINSVSLGGNLIMNVGPTSRGYFDARAEASLDVYAKWMKYNGRSIYGCTMAEPEFETPRGCRLTQSEDGKRLYLHLMEYPFEHLVLPKSYVGKIDYAQLLHDGSELILQENPKVLFDGDHATLSGAVISLPPVKPDVIVPVIELFLK